MRFEGSNGAKLPFGKRSDILYFHLLWRVSPFLWLFFSDHHISILIRFKAIRGSGLGFYLSNGAIAKMIG
jgi:hypothetical protein